MAEVGFVHFAVLLDNTLRDLHCQDIEALLQSSLLRFCSG